MHSWIAINGWPCRKHPIWSAPIGVLLNGMWGEKWAVRLVKFFIMHWDGVQEQFIRGAEVCHKDDNGVVQDVEVMLDTGTF